MARRNSEAIPIKTNRSPAITPQDRENQLIAAAYDLAEQQLLAGTASSQLVVQLVRYGSSREKLEQLKIQQENELLATKREMLESEKRVETLYQEALDAMRMYSGQEPVDAKPEYDEYED